MWTSASSRCAEVGHKRAALLWANLCAVAILCVNQACAVAIYPGGASLTGLNASNLATGTVPDGRFPATLPAASGVNLTALNGTNIASGTVPLARISGLVTGNLSATAGIVDTQLATIATAGKVSDSALSSNVPLKNGTNAWSGVNTFNGTTTVMSADIPALLINTTDSGSARGMLLFERGGAVRFHTEIDASNNTNISTVTGSAGSETYTQALIFTNATGAVQAPVSLKIGAGTAITKILSATGTLDFADTAAGADTDLTVTVTGAADGNVATLGIPNASMTTNGTFTTWISSSNTATVRFHNSGLVTNRDPASGTFRVMVTQF